MTSKILRTLAVPLAAAAALGMSTWAASAAPATTAQTHITDRPDSGAAGDWADDTMTRTLTITRTGGGPGAWTFTAKLTDKGTFTTIAGAATPNQSGPYAGETIKSKVTGKMVGYADFSFTASTLPRTGFNAGVPLTENDHGTAPSDSTSTWYELAFPSGTTFGGAGIGAWSWTYDVTVNETVTIRVCAAPNLCWTTTVHRPVTQQWTDAYNNNAGDDPGDGNVEG